MPGTKPQRVNSRFNKNSSVHPWRYAHCDQNVIFLFLVSESYLLLWEQRWVVKLSIE